jgi:hypothetical protein
LPQPVSDPSSAASDCASSVFSNGGAKRRWSIDSVMARHEIVRQLVDNRWLHRFRIDPDTSAIEQRRDGAWESLAEDA